MVDDSHASRYAAAVEAIYDATIDPSNWPAALDAVGAATGSTKTFLQVVQGTQQKGAAVCRNTPSDFMANYAEWMDSPRNPFRTTHIDLPIYDMPLLRSEVLPDEIYLRTVFYNEFMRPYGCFHGMGILARTGGPGIVMLTLNRGMDDADFLPHERAALSRLSRHIGRAFTLGESVVTARRNLELAAALAESAPGSLAVIGPGNEILHANGRAQRLFTASRLLSFAHGRLHWFRQRDADMFAKLCKRPDGGGMTIRAGGTTLLFVHVTPVRPLPESFGIAQPACLVHFIDPNISIELQSATLIDLFGLTQAEANLACKLATCDTLVEAAQAIGISRNTAKMHQRALYAKLGVASRGALMRILMQSRI